MSAEQLTLSTPTRPVRGSDPVTSREAARGTDPAHDEWLRGHILSFLAALAVRGEGATDDELQHGLLPDEPRSSVSTRRHELFIDGLVRKKYNPVDDRPVKRKTRRKRNAQVYEATDTGVRRASPWKGADAFRVLREPAVARNEVLDRLELTCIDPGCAERFASTAARLQHARTAHGFQTSGEASHTPKPQRGNSDAG